MPRDFRVKPTVNGRAVHLDGDTAISPLNSNQPIGSYPIGLTGFYYTTTQTGWPNYPGFVRTLKTSSTEAFQILADIYGESERARSWDSAAVAWRGWTVVNSGNFASVLHGHNAATAGGASGFMTGADKAKLDGAGRAIGAFSAYQSVEQADLANTAFTKVICNMEPEDVSGWYDPATGVFTPQKAGLYVFSGKTTLSSVVDGKIVVVSVFKNGVRFKDLVYAHTGSNVAISPGGATPPIFANGTTDAFDMRVYHNFGTTGTALPDTVVGENETYFGGFFVGTRT